MELFMHTQVIFEGIVGRGHLSDIAIDEVTIETCGGGGGGHKRKYAKHCWLHFLSVLKS